MIKQFFKKVLISYLIIITFVFAPAVAYADPVTDKIDKLQIDLQKRVGDRWTLSPRNKSVGAGVEIGVSQSYPVTATTTATTAAGATSSNTATLTAEKIGSKIFTPTTANIAKRFAGGVAQGLVAMALYDMLKKSVDYAMNPANNTVTWSDPSMSQCQYTTGWNKFVTHTGTISEVEQSIITLRNTFGDTSSVVSRQLAPNGYNSTFKFVSKSGVPTTETMNIKCGTQGKGTKTFEELAKRSQDIANDPSHKDVATAQSGMQTVVGDMITNNEIDNSYFNDADISNDTYNDVTNNYVTNNITNQYPSVSVPSQAEMAQAAANGQSSVTKTTQNANGSTTTTTTNFNTTNNTTTNNNTYNITNITVNNLVAQKDDSPASTPASTPKPTDSKPFELPAFCDWAKPVCDFIDWVKKEDDEPTELDIPNNVPTPTDTNIRFGGMCPPNAEINVRIPFASINATLFDWSKWCYNLDTFVKPVIILLAAYFSVLIFRGKNESS